MFLVQLLKVDIIVKIDNCQPPLERVVPLSIAKGMVGACPVFDTYKHAFEYAKKDYLILEIKGV